ncbi:MAG: hypothetical protein ACWGMZ_05050, partial [Thermoguttaceae bacterium]
KVTGAFCRNGPSGASQKRRLSPFPTYLTLGKQLGISEGAVKVAVHRLRRRYRKLLKEEIARTVESPDTLEDELRELLAALSSEK